VLRYPQGTVMRCLLCYPPLASAGAGTANSRARPLCCTRALLCANASLPYCSEIRDRDQTQLRNRDRTQIRG
jgi:hypothetical protein